MRGALLVVLVGCGVSASPELGLDAALQVAGAQYRPGPLPSPDGGPDVVQVTPAHTEVTIGPPRERVLGTLGAGSRSAVLGIEGVDGAWILPAGSPTFEQPAFPSVTALIGAGHALAPGPFTLVLFGGDSDGRFGAPARFAMTAVDPPPPEGELVIGLAWDGRADLDLHVVDALGGEAWADDPNTWVPPPPGEPVDPSAYLTGGRLDRDANASCHHDGEPSEHVIWTRPPPAGGYVVRVDARAMCGDASAAWTVTAYRAGTAIGGARGVATRGDVELVPHGAGAGVLALRFTL